MSEKIYPDLNTPEGRKEWRNAHPIERWVEESTGRFFIIKVPQEEIDEAEAQAGIKVKRQNI